MCEMSECAASESGQSRGEVKGEIEKRFFHDVFVSVLRLMVAST